MKSDLIRALPAPARILAVLLALLAVLWTTASSSETSSCVQCHTDKDRLAASLSMEPMRKSELIEGVG